MIIITHFIHQKQFHLLASQQKITDCQAYDLEMAEHAGIQQNASLI